MKSIVNKESLRQALLIRKAEVASEIRHYPGPIPGCDAQFNHLLEVRRILAQELHRLDNLDPGKTISVEDFIDTSPSAKELPDILPLR